MNRANRVIPLLLAALCVGLTGVSFNTDSPSAFDPLDEAFPEWERLFGPPGGYIERIEQCTSSPDVLYAAGGGEGLYRSSDRGATWRLLPGGDRGHGPVLFADPRDPNRVIGWEDGLALSNDGGETWRSISRDFEEEMWVRFLVADPAMPDTLYVAGPRHNRDGCAVFRSTNGGDRWTDVSPGSLPHGASVAGLSVGLDGALLLGINDAGVSGQTTNRLYVSDDAGSTWTTSDYGSIEPRYIGSVYLNPWSPDEAWLSEGPLHNESIGQPLLFRSTDAGRTWSPVTINTHGWDSTQVRVIGSSPDGRIYVAAGSNLLVTEGGGRSFRNITPPRDQMNGVDFFDIEIDPDDSDILYLPLRSGGIAYSEDGGESWVRRDQGIATISPNLIEADPFRPATLYVTSQQGQGIYRSDDYGLTWSGSLDGIMHPWGDEIIADRHREGVLWFIADVPLVHRSDDFGGTWDVVIHPDNAGAFNFGSIYAFAQGSSASSIIVLDNGFGLFRGEGGRWSGRWDWRFLRTSEIDYSYALEIDPADEDIIYSGYSSKPFQDYAMIRQSIDGGDSWRTSLRIDGADAVTSIDIDAGDPNRVFAASTGATGRVWRSDDRGETWSEPNPLFNFTTVHSFALAPSDPKTAFAGVWGGGTYMTRDAGATWDELTDPAAVSAAGIAVDPRDPNTIYIADRTQPVLHRSVDGGATFEVVFDAGDSYTRLMGVTIDSAHPTRLYAIAMVRPSAMDRAPGIHGALFRIEGDAVEDVSNGLPRMPLSITVHPSDSSRIYAVLHGAGVYGSEDAAASWQELSGSESSLPTSGFSSLIVDPHDRKTLYLLGGCDVRFGSFASAGLDPDVVNGVYRSTDGGATWSSLNNGVLGRRSGAVKSLSFVDGSPAVLLATAENGLYVSQDRGASWQSADPPYAALGGAVVADDRVLAMTNGAGIFRGRLGTGMTIAWEPDPLVASEIHFAQVIVDSGTPGTIYASGYPGGIFKSNDDGATWHEANFGMASFVVEDPLRQGYYALGLAPTDSSILYAGLYGRGIYKSIDTAGTWMPMNGEAGTMLGQYVTGLAVDPTDAEIVYVSTESGIYHTRDGGRTWKEANQGMPTTDVKSIRFTRAGELYAGTRGYGLYRLQGERWQAQNPVEQWGVIWPLWDDRPRYQYSDLLIHATDEDRMMLGSFPAGIYVSEDGGENWREKNIGWTLDGVFSLIDHPEEPEIIYAGTYNGVNRSLDFGGHWELWDSGWPSEQWVFRIAFDPRNADVMFACSKNGENEGTGQPGFHGTVMKSADGGAHWFAITTGLSLDQEFYDIVVDPVNPDVLYLASQNEGMFVSTDGGASWHPWNGGLDGRIPATNGNNVTRVLALSGDHRYLYFGTEGAGVFRREIHPPE